jgi:hypothetical protein
MTKTSKKKTLVGATFPKCRARLGYHSVIRPPCPPPSGPLQVPSLGQGLYFIIVIGFSLETPTTIYVLCSGARDWIQKQQEYKLEKARSPWFGAWIPCIRDLVNTSACNEVIWLAKNEWDICSVQAPALYKKKTLSCHVMCVTPPSWHTQTNKQTNLLPATNPVPEERAACCPLSSVYHSTSAALTTKYILFVNTLEKKF